MRRQTKARKNLSREFVFAVRRHEDRLEIFEDLKIKPNTFYQWASGMNKVSVESQLIRDLADRVGFQGSVFE